MMPKHLMRDVVVVVCALSWMVQSAPADEVLLRGPTVTGGKHWVANCLR